MSTSNIKDVVAFLESFAPLAYQEPYDNCGLLVGDAQTAVRGIIVTLDCTEEIVQEAVALGCNLIVAHHPIIFNGLRQLTGRTYVERIVIAAIRQNISIYAAHTNLDNIYLGVNKKIADKLNLVNTRILQGKPHTLSQLITYIPNSHVQQVLNALYEAGAGQIGNYKNCSFNTQGTGTFEPTEKATPHIGKLGQQELVYETRVELIFPSIKRQAIVEALFRAHPYEEVAYFIVPIDNMNQEVGSGIIGNLEKEVPPFEFLNYLKEVMQATVVRHTALGNRPIKKIALSGGAGSYLLHEAIRQNADIYISADFKYHEFFNSEGKIIIADIGHYESEQFTVELLIDILIKKFPNFGIFSTKHSRNPISYL